MTTLLCLCLSAGCGTTQQSTATQQLLESDAIDASIAKIDFTPLAGHKVFFDASYLQDYRGVGFVNSNYVISGIRQQILASGCLLQEQRNDAEYIIEGRLGTLGSDQHDVVYGLPKNNALNTVASAVSNAPALPAIPELALAKKVASHGAAKLAVFAYDRESREPVWQSGLSIANSTARSTWLLGAGPFQHGTIHRDNVEFAGARYFFRPWKRTKEQERDQGFLAYERPASFQGLPVPEYLIAAQEPETPATPAPDTVEPAKLAQQPEAVPIDKQEKPAPEIQQVANEVPAPEKPAASPAAAVPPAAVPTDATPAAPATPASAEPAPTEPVVADASPAEPAPAEAPATDAPPPAETPAEPTVPVETTPPEIPGEPRPFPVLEPATSP